MLRPELRLEEIMYEALLALSLAAGQGPPPQALPLAGPGQAYVVIVLPVHLSPPPAERRGVPAVTESVGPDTLDVCGRRRVLRAAIELSADSRRGTRDTYGYAPQFAPPPPYGYAPQYAAPPPYGYAPQIGGYPYGGGNGFNGSAGSPFGGGFD
jgi:hypothetical protein